MIVARFWVAGLLVGWLLNGHADDALNAGLIEKLKTALPDAEVTAVTPSPVPGIYEVMLGPALLYMSADGRYLFKGDVYDLNAMRNLTDARREKARVVAFEKIGVDNMIEFGPENGRARHAIYVYTDIDCGYCRRMHQEITKLTRAGIAVRYLAYPRSGPNSESYDKAVSVWCSEDRQNALTAAKLGKKVEPKRCASPVDAQWRMGQAMGIRGTPSVYLENGRSIGGYIPADELVKLLDSGKI